MSEGSAAFDMNLLKFCLGDVLAAGDGTIYKFYWQQEEMKVILFHNSGLEN